MALKKTLSVSSTHILKKKLKCCLLLFDAHLSFITTQKPKDSLVSHTHGDADQRTIAGSSNSSDSEVPPGQSMRRLRIASSATAVSQCRGPGQHQMGQRRVHVRRAARNPRGETGAKRRRYTSQFLFGGGSPYALVERAI